MIFFLGVRKEAGDLKGHAWLMINQKPVLDEKDLDYKIIYRYPEEGQTSPSKNILKVID